MTLQTKTQMTTRTQGHREYKWRLRHSKRNYKPGHKWRLGHREKGNINDDRDTQREITDRDTNDNRDTGNINDNKVTGTKLQWGHRGAQGGYINDEGDIGNILLAITINKTQGQSLEKFVIDLNMDCFSHGQLYVACSKVGKTDNLFIYTDNGTAKNVVYSQVLRS